MTEQSTEDALRQRIKQLEKENDALRSSPASPQRDRGASLFEQLQA